MIIVTPDLYWPDDLIMDGSRARLSRFPDASYGVCLSALVPRTRLRLSGSVRGSVGSTPRAVRCIIDGRYPLVGGWLYLCTVYESLRVLNRRRPDPLSRGFAPKLCVIIVYVWARRARTYKGFRGSVRCPCMAWPEARPPHVFPGCGLDAGCHGQSVELFVITLFILVEPVFC